MSGKQTNMSNSNVHDAPDLPLYLMPVAFGLLVYAGTSLLRVLHLVYLNTSSECLTAIATGFVAWIAYSYCVAALLAATERASRASYNPHALLGVDPNESDLQVLKEAFKRASQIHHPDSGGDAHVFSAIYTAYLLLTQQASASELNNYQRYGHPQGTLVDTPALVFTFPSWLLLLDDTVPASMQTIMRVTQVVCLVAAVLYLVQCIRAATKAPPPKTTTTPVKDLLSATQSVAAEDMAYLTRTLRPDTSVLDVLYAILSTPENIAWALQDLDRVAAIRKKRLEDDAKEQTEKKQNGFDALFESDEGWADDEEETEASQKSKAAEAARKAEMEGLKKATGKTKPMLEGIDEGVLGQSWVEKTLQKAGQWPPASLGILQGQTFEYQGKQLGPLEHPGVKRVLCMTLGRLNSNMLNAHPQLIQAGTEKKIDQTYFGASMEFRQRVGMLLEAALRIAMGLQCHSLVSTIVESVAIFKVGCQPGQESIDRFNALMQRQYLCLPRLAVNYKELKVHVKTDATATTPEETKEMADARKGTTVVEDLHAGETAEFGLDLDRIFAENLFLQKSAALQKQGIPPQVALQSYREGWWVLLRYERLDGETALPPLEPPANMVKALSLDDATMQLFAQAKPRLATGWPVLIPNIKQKILKIKIQFKAPKVTGKYRVFVSIKSQDFLGADQEVYLDTQVVEAPNKKDQ